MSLDQLNFTQRIDQGDETVWHELTELALPWAMRILGNMEDSRECVQDALLTLSIARPEEIDNVRALLFAITNRRAIDLLRRRSRFAEVIRVAAREPTNGSECHSDEVERRDQVAKLEWCIDRLPSKLRKLIELKRDGLTGKQAVVLSKMSERMYYRNILKAEGELKNCMEKKR